MIVSLPVFDNYSLSKLHKSFLTQRNKMAARAKNRMKRLNNLSSKAIGPN